MKKRLRLNIKEAQAALEYMLLLAVVVAIVLIGFQTYLPRVQKASEIYFNETANIIMGEDPISVPPPAFWSAWSGCSAPCGGGTQTRTCSVAGGCSGPSSQPCNTFPCPPTNGGWCAPGPCSAPCGAITYSTRLCQCPPPSPGGQNCVGPQFQICPFIPCLNPGCTWTPWAPDPCPTPCGGCVQTRQCVCDPLAPAGTYCPPDADGLALVRTINTQGCDCPSVSFTSQCNPSVPLVTPSPTTPNNTTLPMPCPAGCSGNFVVACHNGAWNFVADTCGCNMNGVCEAGEDEFTCCNDCGPGGAAPICGDGVCCADIGEDITTCPADCSVCGDGICAGAPIEDENNCCDDCGPGGAVPVCGDGICCAAIGEDATSCASDCACVMDCTDGFCCTSAGEDTVCGNDCGCGTINCTAFTTPMCTDPNMGGSCCNMRWSCDACNGEGRGAGNQCGASPQSTTGGCIRLGCIAGGALPFDQCTGTFCGDGTCQDSALCGGGSPETSSNCSVDCGGGSGCSATSYSDGAGCGTVSVPSAGSGGAFSAGCPGGCNGTISGSCSGSAWNLSDTCQQTANSACQGAGFGGGSCAPACSFPEVDIGPCSPTCPGTCCCL